MDYALRASLETDNRATVAGALRRLAPLVAEEKPNLLFAVLCVIFATGAQLVAPIIVAHVIDTILPSGDYGQLFFQAGMLALLFLLGLAANYNLTLRMGGVGQNVVFNMRNRLFAQLGALPVAFFSQNRLGDLISRVNSDTEKLNQFFSQSLMQLFGNVVIVVGAGALLLALHPRLGFIVIIPALVLLVLTRAISPFIKQSMRRSMEAGGALSGDVSETLANFEVIVAFNREDYFRQKFALANDRNYQAGLRAGILSGLLMPIFTFAGSAASILILGFGAWFVASGTLTIGLLIGYLMYATSFYNPLRQMAGVWSSLQQAVAACDRMAEILALSCGPVRIEDGKDGPAAPVLMLDNVSFSYPGGKQVLENVTLRLEAGRTYALVGPTGGGKTTTAMVMARLYDPTQGTIFLGGRDIRSMTSAERAAKIGFILQEPVLFSGTVGSNILYGHEAFAGLCDEKLMHQLAKQELDGILRQFNNGLATPVGEGGEGLSLGQRQLVAFLRAILRAPELLILDEATANIDTITEGLLEQVLDKLPAATTKVIIAHRLSSIRSADEIYFVGTGALVPAGSMEHALEMLFNSKLVS